MSSSLEAISIDQGLHCPSKRLRHWRALITEWFELLEIYCRQIPGDIPYWHNERAQIGLLAAAAWRCGFLALEEFSQRKRSGRARTTGRSDLWLKQGEHEDFVEVKTCYPPRPLVKTPQWIRHSLKEACDEAKRIVRDKSTRSSVGLVLVRARIPRDQEIKTAIHELIERVARVTHDVLFWHFDQGRRAWPDTKWEPKSVYPGIVGIARVARTREP